MIQDETDQRRAMTTPAQLSLSALRDPGQIYLTKKPT
jgi:hypothetical protein